MGSQVFSSFSSRRTCVGGAARSRRLCTFPEPGGWVKSTSRWNARSNGASEPLPTAADFSETALDPLEYLRAILSRLPAWCAVATDVLFCSEFEIIGSPADAAQAI